MKRTFLIAVALCVTFSTIALAASELYPVEVWELADGGNHKIVRAYELAPDDDPDAIPRDAFERGGYSYELTEIVKQETELDDTVEHTETVTLTTESKDLATVLPLLAPTMEYVSEDGYAGILVLDTTTVVTVDGTKRNQAYTLNVTREYPHLETNDTSLLPKTVTERGLTYTLESVDWRSRTSVGIDYSDVPMSYDAVATYKTSGSSVKVTDYVTTAEYRGEITRRTPGKTRYTAYFAGKPMSTPAPTSAIADVAAPKSAFNPMPLLIAVGVIALLGGGGWFAYKKLKIKKF